MGQLRFEVKIWVKLPAPYFCPFFILGFFSYVDNKNISAVGGSFTIGLHGLHGLIHEHFFTFNTYYMIASACLYILVIIQLSIGMYFDFFLSDF